MFTFVNRRVVTMQKAFQELPLRFWILVAATFVDGIGSTMLRPFIALYITGKFNVGMTEAGLLLGSFSLFGLIGNFVGGALTDRFGRKGMLLFGLVASGLSSLLIGFAWSVALLYSLSVVIGLLSSIGHPAQQAMVADMLPEEQRADGFGILRVSANLAWIIGPTLGGLIAVRSYMPLFILDAVLSVVTGVIVYRLIPETRPTAGTEQKSESLWQTLLGYRMALRDVTFLAFVVVSI